MKGPKFRISAITNGINYQGSGAQFDSEMEKNRLGFNAHFIVIQAGSMSVSDGLDVLLDAAELLKDEETIRFVLIGDGDVKPALVNKTKEKRLTNVTFLPPQAKTLIGRYLTAADITIALVQEFYADCALPNRFFDYMAAGKPVVSSGTGDIREILDTAQAGIVVPPGNSQELAKAILYLYRNPVVAKTMGENAQRFIFQKYSWDHLYPRYRNVYLTLFNETKQSKASLPQVDRW